MRGVALLKAKIPEISGILSNIDVSFSKGIVDLIPSIQFATELAIMYTSFPLPGPEDHRH